MTTTQLFVFCPCGRLVSLDYPGTPVRFYSCLHWPVPANLASGRNLFREA